MSGLYPGKSGYTRKGKPSVIQTRRFAKGDFAKRAFKKNF